MKKKKRKFIKGKNLHKKQGGWGLTVTLLCEMAVLDSITHYLIKNMFWVFHLFEVT